MPLPPALRVRRAVTLAVRWRSVDSSRWPRGARSTRCGGRAELGRLVALVVLLPSVARRAMWRVAVRARLPDRSPATKAVRGVRRRRGCVLPHQRAGVAHSHTSSRLDDLEAALGWVARRRLVPLKQICERLEIRGVVLVDQLIRWRRIRPGCRSSSPSETATVNASGSRPSSSRIGAMTFIACSGGEAPPGGPAGAKAAIRFPVEIVSAGRDTTADRTNQRSPGDGCSGV